MDLPLTLRHRPSNGLLLFAGQTATVGLVMILAPDWVRNHDAFDFLDYVNLPIMGIVIMALAACQLVADAVVCHVWRAVASCAAVGVYSGLALGVFCLEPAMSGVMYAFGAAINLLLAIRRI